MRGRSSSFGVARRPDRAVLPSPSIPPRPLWYPFGDGRARPARHGRTHHRRCVPGLGFSRLRESGAPQKPAGRAPLGVRGADRRRQGARSQRGLPRRAAGPGPVHGLRRHGRPLGGRGRLPARGRGNERLLRALRPRSRRDLALSSRSEARGGRKPPLGGPPVRERQDPRDGAGRLEEGEHGHHRRRGVPARRAELDRPCRRQPRLSLPGRSHLARHRRPLAARRLHSLEAPDRPGDPGVPVQERHLASARPGRT